jgi:beta-N-acetylhexosaminidase
LPASAERSARAALRRRPAALVAAVAVCLVSACTGAAPTTTGAPTAAATSTVPASAPNSATSPTGRPAATATPTPPTAANPAGLTDQQLVGQLFTEYVYGASATSASPAQQQANLALYGAATGAQIVRRWHLGGIILLDHNNLDPARPELSTGNVGTAAQISALTAGLQQAALADSGIRLLIGTDQEGGSVQRIRNGVDWRPSQLQLSQQSPATLRCSYLSLGRQLSRLGVNQDYAPVADVVRVTGGVIGDRSFGPDPATDAQDVLAAVTGLQAAGVLATLKHWPGHGSTPVNSHEALPVLTETASQWRATDRPPFQAAAATVASVMVGHLALPALDPTGRPATLSPVLVGQQLRHGLGYAGLVVTDSLWMAPMRQAGSPGEVAIRAVQAGDDMLLMSPDLPAGYQAVLTKVRTDRAFRNQVQAAVRRILAAKARAVPSPAVPAGC